MYDDVPIVPNLYEAPSNPQVKDCYYNITLDKYYIYDGTQWLEAKLENDPSIIQDVFELKYSTDGGENFTTETYTNYDALCTALNSKDNATDVIITTPVYPAIIVPRSNDTSLDGVALLKFKSSSPGKRDIFTLKYSKDNGISFTTENYNEFWKLTDRLSSTTMSGVTDVAIDMEEVEDQNLIIYDEEEIVGKIYPKIIFNQKLVENLYTNGIDTQKSIFDGVLVFYNPVGEIGYEISTNYDGSPFTDGQIITVSFTIKNTGTIPLQNITVWTEFNGEEFTMEDFEVGEEQNYQSEYIITQADIVAGNLPWDWNYTAEYIDLNDNIHTISNSFIYNIHPPIYKVSYRANLNDNYTVESYTDFGDVVTKVRSLDNTIKDLKVEEE